MKITKIKIDKLKIPLGVDLGVSKHSMNKAQSIMAEKGIDEYHIIVVYRNVVLSGYNYAASYLFIESKVIPIKKIENSQEYLWFKHINNKENIKLNKTFPIQNLLRECNIKTKVQRCYICNRTLLNITGAYDRCKTFDHIIPKSKVHKLKRNTIYCCRRCNDIKADIPYSKELTDIIRIEQKKYYKEKIYTNNIVINTLHKPLKCNNNTCNICGKKLTRKIRARKSMVYTLDGNKTIYRFCRNCKMAINGIKIPSEELFDIIRIQKGLNDKTVRLKELHTESKKEILKRMREQVISC